MTQHFFRKMGFARMRRGQLLAALRDIADEVQAVPAKSVHEFTAAEIGALAHLYRGEVYRSTIWRTRLDNTTNWAVAALGLAISASFSQPEASALPLVLIGILIIVFLVFEARRYRYFNVWRARARWLETNFYAPMLRGQGCNPGMGWEQVLAKDYVEPRHHISMARAIGRRLRRTYIWLLTIQTLAYLGKIAIHPSPVAGIAEFIQRASVGPIPGEVLLISGLMFNEGWLAFALVTFHLDRVAHGKGKRVSMG